MCKDDDLADCLWNEGAQEQYSDRDKHMDHVLEQYKLYVEMADRISARRATANTFFLTVNTLVVGAVALCSDSISQFAAVIVCVAAVVLCYVWQRLIKSYRQLNTAKYRVVGEMEKKLPCSPYWSAEWKALGEGKDPKKYRQLTAVERWVPVVFICLYVLLGAAITKQCWWNRARETERDKAPHAAPEEAKPTRGSTRTSPVGVESSVETNR